MQERKDTGKPVDGGGSVSVLLPWAPGSLRPNLEALAGLAARPWCCVFPLASWEAGRPGRTGLGGAAVVALHDSCGKLLRELRDKRLGRE